MPKASLLYEKYCVLNEINNLRIDNERISVPLKQEIFETLFLKGRKVTKKKLFHFLRSKGLVVEESQIGGIDTDVNNALVSYGRFLPVFGEQLKRDDCKKMAEDIIFWCTVYGDSKEFLRQQLTENYADKLTGDQIRRIMGMRMRDWGNLSKEMLELPGCDKDTGEEITLIRAMWENNLNLMELINSDRFTFKQELENKQNKGYKLLAEYTADDLQEEYFSAPVKRMIWQTLSVIKEIEKIMGNAPSRIFLEMTREEGEKGEKGRKVSRKTQLLELYKRIKSESAAWKRDMSSKIEKYDETGALRSKKLYLYFVQKGMDMYTGEPIDLDDLLSANSRYDIDHIYPRHFVKDDNINNNLVLASKKVNAGKLDSYPLDKAIYSKMKDRWQMLHEEKLISDEKYRRLTGRQPLSDEQKAGFIARQLVETGQGTKGVADLLKQLLPETKIVYSKASNVAEFRNIYGLYKCRAINDFHHANDAYLNIVVGNVYFTKFTQDPLNFIRKDYASGDKKYAYHLSKMFEWDVVRNNEVAWVAEHDGMPGTIVIVKKMMARNTPLLTRLSFEAHGGLTDATIYSHKEVKSEGYIPVKTSDGKLHKIERYGGLTSVKAAYYFLVEHGTEKKRIRTLETVPIYLKGRLEKSEDELILYCRNELGLENPSVRMRKIKIQSLLKIDGYYLHISSKTNKQFSMRNAVPLCISAAWGQYVNKLEKAVESGYENEIVTAEKNLELYDLLLEKHAEGIFAKRPNNMGEKISEGREKFEKLSVEQQNGVLLQLLRLTSIGITQSNLLAIGGAEKSGMMLISKKISSAHEFVLINQSVTGLYENSIDLLTV